MVDISIIPGMVKQTELGVWTEAVVGLVGQGGAVGVETPEPIRGEY